MKWLNALLILFYFCTSAAFGQSNEWIRKKDMSGSARSQSISFSIGNFGYVGLGETDVDSEKKYFWKYDPSSNTWSRVADFPGENAPRRSFVINGKAYLLGGYSPNSGYTNLLWEYNPENNSWTEKASFPSSIGEIAVAFAIGDKGYAGVSFSSNEFYEYDPIEDKWTRKADFDGQQRVNAASFTLLGKGYVSTGGGVNPGYGTYGYLNDLWQYDPELNEWTQKTDAPIHLHDGIGFSIGGKGYLSGGYSFNTVDGNIMLFEYNPETNTWTKKADFPGGRRAAGIGFAIHDKGYLGTGTLLPGNLKDFWQYSPYDCVVPDVIVSADRQELCMGESTTLRASGAAHYIWSPLDGLSGENISGTVVGVTPKANTTYRVSGVDYNGCEKISEVVIVVNSLPTIEINTPSTICIDTPKTIEATGATTYTWSPEGGLSATHGSLVTVNPISTTTVYTIEGTDDHGCVSETSLRVSLKPNGNFELPSNPICENDTVDIPFEVVTDNTTAEWNFDDGIAISNNIGQWKVKWITDDVKTVRLTIVRDACQTVVEKNLTVKDRPSNLIQAPTLICGEGKALIIATIQDEETTYDWTFDNATILSGSGAGPYELSWSEHGVKEINLVTGKDGCYSETISTTINFSGYPVIDFVKSPGALCFGSNYSIQYVGSNSSDLQWEFGDANVVSGSGAGPFILNWITPGLHQLAFSTSNNGCIKDSVISVVIAPEANIPSICMVTVDDTSGKNKLLWTYDVGTVNRFGIYRETNVSGIYALLSYVDRDEQNMFIDFQSNPLQQSNRYSITAVDTCDVETAASTVHKTIHLTINKGTGSSWNLQWDGYDGLAFGTYRIHRSTNGGPFELLTEVASNLTSFTDLDVTSNNVQYQIEIVMDACAFPGSGDKIYARSNVAASAVVGVDDEYSSTHIQVSPNPSSHEISIKLASSSEAGFKLTDIDGRILRSGRFTKEKMEDVSMLPSGMYILFIQVNNHQSYVKKLIVTH